MARPLVIGLTGGIGSGKSTVAALLRERGIPVIDADELAREVTHSGQPAFDEIVATFGDTIVDAKNGEIDRRQLGRRVFSDPAAREALMRITHPRIAELAKRRFAEAAAQGHKRVVYEAALLVETGIYRSLDGLIVVDAATEQQVARVQARDGLSEEEARDRVAAQLPLADKVAVADWAVDNRGGLGQTRAEVERVWAAVEARPLPG